jgi:hypothetical protein
MANCSSIEAASRNFAAIYRLLNHYKPEFHMDAIARAILGKPFPGEGVDLRKARLPSWAIPFLKGLCRWFEPDEHLQPIQFRKFRADGFRKTSYAELAKIYSKAMHLSDNCIRAALDAFEKAGILEREAKWIPDKNKTEFHIRLNAGRLLKIVADLPIIKLRGCTKRDVEISPENIKSFTESPVVVNHDVFTSIHSSCSPGSSVPVSVPDSGSGSVVEDKNTSVSASPSPSGIFCLEKPIKIGTGKTVRIERKATELLPKLLPVFGRSDFTEANLVLLERKVTAPIKSQRLTLERLEHWIYFRNCHADQPEFNVDTLREFLIGWSHIWRKVEHELTFKEFCKGEEFFRDIRQAYDIAHYSRVRVCEAIERREHETGVSKQLLLARLPIFREHEDGLLQKIGRFMAARDYQLLMTEAQVAELRIALKEKPHIYFALKDKLPLRQWAGLDAVEGMRMFAKHILMTLHAHNRVNRGLMCGHEILP